MYPITTAEVVHAEQSRRLEGFRRWSLRRGQVAVTDVEDTRAPQQGHRPGLRPAIGF